MRIHTYYHRLPRQDIEDNTRLLVKWHDRWHEAGWQPFILNLHIAQQHPLFAQLDQAIQQQHKPDTVEYHHLIRWLALAQVGGGWLSHYDVFPREEWDARADSSKVLYFEQQGALAWASAENAVQHVTLLLKGDAAQQVMQRPAVVKEFMADGWKKAPVVHFTRTSADAKGLNPRWRYVDDVMTNQF